MYQALSKFQMNVSLLSQIFKGLESVFFLKWIYKHNSKKFGLIVCFLTIIVIFFYLVALHTAAKKPDRQFNCIFFRSRISERNSISFCCLRDSKLGSRQINHFLAKNKKMQLLESFLPNSIVYLIVKSPSVSQKSSYSK